MVAPRPCRVSVDCCCAPHLQVESSVFVFAKSGRSASSCTVLWTLSMDIVSVINLSRPFEEMSSIRLKLFQFRIQMSSNSHDTAWEHRCKACDPRHALPTPPNTPFEHQTGPPTLWGSSVAEDSTSLAHAWPQQHRIDVHDSSGSWEMTAGAWKVTGHVSISRAFGHARRWGWDMWGQKGRLSYHSSDAPMHLQTNALRAQVWWRSLQTR